MVASEAHILAARGRCRLRHCPQNGHRLDRLRFDSVKVACKYAAEDVLAKLCRPVLEDGCRAKIPVKAIDLHAHTMRDASCAYEKRGLRDPTGAFLKCVIGVWPDYFVEDGPIGCVEEGLGLRMLQLLDNRPFLDFFPILQLFMQPTQAVMRPTLLSLVAQHPLKTLHVCLVNGVWSFPDRLAGLQQSSVNSYLLLLLL